MRRLTPDEKTKLAADWQTDAETEAADEVPSEDGVMKAVLICRQPGGTKVVDLADGDVATFGRALECTVTIDQTKVSRKHARVTWRKGALVVEDLGSRNGTVVNGRTLRGEATTLTGATSLRIGDCHIVVAALSGATTRTHDDQTPEDAGLLVADTKMQEVLAVARKVARTPTTVLIVGETGVGKEEIATFIHRSGPRRDGPLVRVNSAAIAETLLESEFFGHEKGAFTGADRRKIGYVEAAHGGTLFIDEVGDMSLQAQVKLLRVLENRVITRVGGTAEIPIDVRIICATHRDLASLVQSSTFRADLFYRVGAFTLRIPPLRERSAEIPLLAELFARNFARAAGDPPPVLDKDLLEVIGRFDWPGNVRQLRNAVEHALVMAEGATVRAAHLPEEITRSQSRAPSGLMPARLAEIERRSIEDALAAENGNQTRAAVRLGISRRALVYKLSIYRRGG